MHTFTCEPNLTINGETLRAYLYNEQNDIIEPLFKKHGMADPVPGEWYPLQPVLDFLKELSTSSGSSANLVAVGVKLAEFGVEPEDIIAAPLPVVLEHWQDHMDKNIIDKNTGEGGAGMIKTEKVDDKFYKIAHNNLFPDDLCYGLAYGFCRSRLPLGTNFKVWYEDYNNRIDNGDAEETVICIQWE
jgi:hypothetical protein